MPPRHSTKAATKPSTPAVTALPPPPTTSGREQNYSSKQQELVIAKANKDAVAKKKLLTEALCVRQDQEEISGYTPFAKIRTDRHDRTPPESEDEEYEDFGLAKDTSAFTLQPAIKASIHDGRVLVHRVASKENEHPAKSQSEPTPLCKKPLVRRAGDQIAPTPFMTLDDVPRGLNMEPQHRERHLADVTPGPYSLHMESLYERGDGTYYHSHHRVPAAERKPYRSHRLVPSDHNAKNISEADSEDESFLGYRGDRYPEPTRYIYPDAHPELEAFPRSSFTGSSSSGSRETEAVLGIRKTPPTNVSAASSVVTKKPKVETTGSRGRVRASDFDDLTKAILEDAISEYRTCIFTENPYPDRVQDREWSSTAWVNACTARKIRIEFDDDLAKLITKRASQGRGQVKGTARPFVEVQYELDTDDSKREVRDKAENLLDRGSFLYKDPATRTGIFRHPIFQAVINKMWYKNRSDEGGIRPEFCDNDGIPFVTMALVAAAVECCIDEKQTGEHVDVPFSAAVYHEKFLTHLKTLEALHMKTKDVNAVPRICKQVLKNARKHAKIDATPAARTFLLEEADIEAMKKEWENLVLTDEE